MFNGFLTVSFEQGRYLFNSYHLRSRRFYVLYLIGNMDNRKLVNYS